MARQTFPAGTGRTKPIGGRFLTYAALGFWGLVCLFPVYWLLVTSFKGEMEIAKGPFYLPFIDFRPALESWRFILFDRTDSLVLQLFNSATIGLSATAATVLFAGLFVYGMTRFRFTRGRMTLPAALLATRILPPVVIVLPVYIMAQRIGMLDSRFALIVTYAATNLPIAVWLLMPIFGRAASEPEEAALLDGASHLRIFATVVVPMFGAGIAAVGFIVFVLCWNEYLFAAYLAAGRTMTLPPWVIGQLSMKEAQVGGDLEEWSKLSAALILLVTIPLLFGTLFARRVLRRVGAWRDSR